MTKLAYILAASHSGSTLLSMLLGSHPADRHDWRNDAIPQSHGRSRSLPLFLRRIHPQVRFWAKVRDGMAKRGCDFDLADAGTDYRSIDSRYVQRLLGSDAQGKTPGRMPRRRVGVFFRMAKELPEIHGRNAALASTVSELADHVVIVDSSKIGVRLKYLLRNPELDVKVIRLIRDGRAVALTYMDPAGFADQRIPTSEAGGMGGNRAREKLSMTQAAYEWRRSMEEAEHVLRTLDPSRRIEVRYEDYCRDSDATLGRLHEFLGVDPGRQPRRFRDVEQHVVGNGMRLDTTSEIRLDERWKEHLTKGELQVFDRVAGRMNRHYGYV